jgi:acyl carrier protein
MTAAAATAPPSGSLEQAVAEVWRRALGGGPVNIDASFFDLGGSSMLMIWVQQQLEAETGLQVPVLTLFEYPTVRALAAHLAGPVHATAARPGGPAPGTRSYPDSQRRLTIRRQLELKDLS